MSKWPNYNATQTRHVVPPTEYIHQVSNWYLKACWQKVWKTQMDGGPDTQTDRRMDEHCHSIIRPFLKGVYNNKNWSLPNHKITTMGEPSTTTYEMEVLIRYQLTPTHCSLGWITGYYHWTLRLTSMPSLSTWTKSSHKLLNWKFKLLGFSDIILLKIWLHKWWENLWFDTLIDILNEILDKRIDSWTTVKSLI